MTTNLVPTDMTTAQAMIAQAIVALRGQGDRPPAAAVVAALLQAEKAAKQQHVTYALDQLAGTWQLVFTAPRSAHQKAGVAQGKGFYVPRFAPAQISFRPDGDSLQTGTIGNQIQFGAAVFKLTGPLKYPGKKNLLGFDFTQATFTLFGQTLYDGKFQTGKAKPDHFDQLKVAQLPFFAFFLVTDEFVAARGRGGGLAIWMRQPDRE